MGSMTKTTSLYLDLMRLLTALVVFLGHANYGRFTDGLPVIRDYKFLGNDGVMVFFVLSGFVIAYVADRKEIQIVDYGVSRLARLYSVAVPAVLLTMVLDFLGTTADFRLYDGWWFQADNPLWRISANLLFINELWFSSVRLFSNGPFWSLGYEFWYYVIFGAAWYLEGRTRWLAVAAAMLIAGPKIVMLLPVWLLGVWAYRVTRANTLGEGWGWALYLGSAAGYALFQHIDGPKLLLAWTTANLDGLFHWSEFKWSYAMPFLSSYLIGGCAALHFVGFAAVGHRFERALSFAAPAIRHFAGFTFSIYLFHYPLLQFFTAATGGIADRTLKTSVILIGTLGVVYLVGSVTEKRKGEVKRLILAGYAALRRGVALCRQE